MESKTENLMPEQHAAALNQAEMRFMNFCNAMNSGIALYRSIDGERFVFTGLNAAGAAMTEVRQEDVIGCEVRDVFPGVVRMGLYDVFRRVWASGEPETLPTAFYKDDRIAHWYENRVFKISEHEIAAVYDDISVRKNTEDSLRESEFRFRSLFDSMHEGFAFHEVICDDAGIVIDYRYLDLNPAFERLTGLQREKALGRTVRELIPGIEEHWITTFGQVALSGEPAELENYVRELDRYYRAKAYSPVRGKFAVVFEEVTEQKKLLRSLQEREAELRVLFESSQAGIILVDPSGRIVMANQRMAEMFGCDLAKLIDSTYSSHVHPDQRAIGDDQMCRLIAGDIDHVNYERHYIRLDGSDFWGYLSCRRHEDVEGKLISLVGHISDFTELKTVRDNMQSSLQRLQVYFERMPMGCIVWDVNFNALEWNPAAERIFGHTADEAFGISAYELIVPPSQRGHVRQVWQNLLKGKIFVHSINENVTRDGRIIICEWHNTPLFTSDGKINRVLSMVQDITDQKQAEDERLSLERQLLHAHKLESLGVLAGGIAHDFNNILTAIMGNISYARIDMDASQHAYMPLARAEMAAKRAAGLARQLLVFAKGGEPVKKLISLRQTVDDAVSLALSGTSVQALIDLPDGLLAVNADEGQINQAFHNIIINAVQAMPAGGRLTVSGRTVALNADNGLGLTGGDYVKISFADEGCGIAAGDIERVFDPYFTSNKSGGTGLGLASTYSIVKKHDGHITVSSTPGRGATFTILLPGFRKPVAAEVTDDHASNTARGIHSILVMDDDEMVRELAAITLKRLGYIVVCCADGAAAISLYRAALDEGEPFSLVITDLTIPGGMGGIEVARQILAFDPEARLIVSSGYSDDPVMANFTDYGFCASLEKPYNVEEVARILQQGKRGSSGQC